MGEWTRRASTRRWVSIAVDGLRAQPDPTFDRYARIVRDAVDVPMALVTVVCDDRQIIPGAAGLPELWERLREAPLTHSVCRFVVGDEAPVVVADTRADPRLESTLAHDALGVVSYAGVPLRDADDVVVGAVCAIDSAPRQWTGAQLRVIEDLAALCSAELAARRPARGRPDTSSTDLLLSLSEALAGTVTVTDVVEALAGVVAQDLGCTRVGIWLRHPASPGVLRYVEHPNSEWTEAQRADIPYDASSPIGSALVDLQPHFFRDRAEQDARFPRLRAPVRMADSTARAALPLSVANRRLGTLVLFWPVTRRFTDGDRAIITALAGYTAQAVSRATLLAERTEVSRTLQAALLPASLPQSPDLEVRARYRAAALHDLVGGDWYDCVALPGGALHLMIGDVRGHDMRAAAAMGTVRTMLRALAWARQDSPSSTVGRLDQAVSQFGMDAPSTLVFARLDAPSADGRRVLEWTNAGHPPPIVVDAHGRCTLLDDARSADTMLGVGADRARHDQAAELAPGSTLLLYTDGLLESDHHDVDVGLARLVTSLERNHRLPLVELLDRVIAELVGLVPDDDVAVIAVRLAN